MGLTEDLNDIRKIKNRKMWELLAAEQEKELEDLLMKWEQEKADEGKILDLCIAAKARINNAIERRGDLLRRIDQFTGGFELEKKKWGDADPAGEEYGEMWQYYEGIQTEYAHVAWLDMLCLKNVLRMMEALEKNKGIGDDPRVRFRQKLGAAKDAVNAALKSLELPFRIIEEVPENAGEKPQ